MASAQVAIPHDINTAGLHNMESKFQQKQQQAPPSPDGAEMAPQPSKDAKSLKSLPNPPVELQVQPKPTLPVPSIASRIQSKNRTPEERKAKITRQATQAFEKQTGKTISDDMSAAEWAIYNAEVQKSEEHFEKKRADEEAAVMLANNIKYREHHLNEMTNELARKVEQFQMGQEELVKVTKEFEELVNAQVAAEAPADVSGIKSSSVRMEEEKKKKALKNAYRHSVSNDPVTQARQRQFVAAEDIASLKARIEETRKELGRMMGQASKGKSSLHRMREEQEIKNQKRASGIVSDAPIKVYVKKEAPVRSHMTRMEEEKERKAEARRLARQSLDAGELAGRPRSGTTSF